MRIAEVEDHIGEEWRAGAGRVRIEGVDTMEEHAYGLRRNTRRVRWVRCTLLDVKLGGPLDVPDPIVWRKPADLSEPWADYAERARQADEIEAATIAAADRLEAILGAPISRVSVSSGSLRLTYQQAAALADAYDKLAAVERHEAREDRLEDGGEPFSWTPDDTVPDEWQPDPDSWGATP